jgi:hypothetical protein
LLDTLKLSSQNMNGSMTKKRIPVDPPLHGDSSMGPGLTFTQLTESLSEDISDAFTRTYDRIVNTPHHMPRSQSHDDKSNMNMGSGWAAYVMPPAFGVRQTKSDDHDHYYTENEPRDPHMPHNLDRSTNFDTTTNDDICIKRTESEEAWEEDGEDDVQRDVSLLDIASQNPNSEAGDDYLTDYTDDDDSSYLSGADTVGSSGGVMDDVVTVKDGLVALGGIFYEIGTCTFQDQVADSDDDYSGNFPNSKLAKKQTRGRSRSPRTPPASGDASAYLGFDQAGVTRTHGQAFHSAPAPNKNHRGGLVESMFSCAG